MDLTEKVKKFPASPGVYLMKDLKGVAIYIGKAKSLRHRVKQYFQDASGERYHIQFLMKRVADIDIVLTDTEKEALFLERTLIKKHKPKYNIDLKDDKSYISLKLTTQHEFPRLLATRDIKKDGAGYFGPYASAAACRETLDFLVKQFRLRTCTDHELRNRSRPCLQYEIKRCTAPCVSYVSTKDYGEQVRKVRLFLEGKNQELRVLLVSDMQRVSEAMEYEEAARLRDHIRDIDQTLEKQKFSKHGTSNQDFIGFYREGEYLVVTVMAVRAGRVWEARHYYLESLVSDEGVLEEFLSCFYGEGRSVPDVIFVPTRTDGMALFGKVLSPSSGDAADMVKLATRNAQEAFRQHRDQKESREEILLRLQESLGLRNFPRVMECYDISNFQGRDAVGSMVSFVDGEPLKAHYRRFKIKTVLESNDPAMMAELLKRRFSPSDFRKTLDPPDLLVIDGGKGQLGAVLATLKDLQVLGVDCMGLAKQKEGERQDKIFLPGRKNPLRLPPHSSILHLLMRIRDEAHRFAVTYHKKLRSKRTLTSFLNRIPGLGPKRRQVLLRYFGSLSRVRKASLDDIKKVPGFSENLAERVYQVLQEKDS